MLKKIVVSLILISIVQGCSDSSSMSPENLVEGTKEDLIAAIDAYKESMYNLGAQPIVSSASARNEENTIHSKDLIQSSNYNRFDSEWLAMSVLVLNFAEALTETGYELGSEVFYHDVLEDESIWGWAVYENTRVILSYKGKVMYLRVINDNLIQTFFFQYVQGDLIKIFRLFEKVTPEGNQLYIEDFSEGKGLTLWWSRDQSFSNAVVWSDGWTYGIYSSNPGQKVFTGASGFIEDVPVTVYDQNWSTYVSYDFKFVDVFDSFAESGQLYKNNEEILMPVAINVYKQIRSGEAVFYVTGTKELSGENSSLALAEAGINTNLTLRTILNNVTKIYGSSASNGVSYNYSLGAEAIFEELEDILYLEY